jgi:hypothetical protein
MAVALVRQAWAFGPSDGTVEAVARIVATVV